MVETAAVVATAFVVALGGRGGGSFQYCYFSNTKPLEFDGVKDPIIAEIVIRCRGVFLHLFLSRGLEFQMYCKPPSTGCEEMEEHGDWFLYF